MFDHVLFLLRLINQDFIPVNILEQIKKNFNMN